ncbi:DUF2798 domain-containing protein [Mesorhizobium sp. M7A.F.Ca.MR.176.00.0.0]|nr:DUF2798 domain-containing protein [Mesorhizobium sp. M7A.F.Ca.MR.176.00.0.0]RUU89758.1 DUF2798 domain-containing protein [Mesorhizobium sp. M7A.F.Ca.MR.176.00.0.0]
MRRQRLAFRPGSSLVVAFPTLLLVLPIVRRIVGALCEPASR